MEGDDLIERHVDLFAGVGSIVWTVIVTVIVPDGVEVQLAAICPPTLAAVFGVGALARWYRKVQKRRSAVPAKDA